MYIDVKGAFLRSVVSCRCRLQHSKRFSLHHMPICPSIQLNFSGKHSVMIGLLQTSFTHFHHCQMNRGGHNWPIFKVAANMQSRCCIVRSISYLIILFISYCENSCKMLSMFAWASCCVLVNVCTLINRYRIL